MSEWRTDTPPMNEYLLFSGERSVFTGKWRGEVENGSLVVKSCYGSSYTRKAVAWMPLPKPYTKRW